MYQRHNLCYRFIENFKLMNITYLFGFSATDFSFLVNVSVCCNHVGVTMLNRGSGYGRINKKDIKITCRNLLGRLVAESAFFATDELFTG